jgi:hypothetical protein
MCKSNIVFCTPSVTVAKLRYNILT